jgi:hypothetical protein
MRLSLLVTLVVSAAGCSGGNTVTSTAGAGACATASACGLFGQSGIQQCSSGVLAVNSPAYASAHRDVAQITGAQVNCLAAAGKDCNAAEKCLNNGDTPMSCSTAGPQSCSGNTLRACTNLNGQDLTTQFDCSFYGETCVSGKNEVACGLGTCSGGGATCMQDELQTCDTNGVTHQFDCAAFGATCVPGALAHCRGKSPNVCTGPLFGIGDNSLRCDGNTLVNCFDGQEANFDCGQVQLNCVANANGAHAACALGNECNPATAAVTCTGTVLHFCNNGKNDTFDCAKGGWTTCDPSNGGRCS